MPIRRNILGLQKHLAMEELDKEFYSIGEKFVCAKCVGDKDLGNFIKVKGEKSKCSYCNKKNKKVIHFDILLKYMLECIHQEYDDPNNAGVAWEQGWVGDVFDSYDLIIDHLCIPIENNEFQDDLLVALEGKEWCARDFYQLNPGLALSYGWKEFVNTVKHKSRYVFYRIDNKSEFTGSEEIPPNYFLDALCSIIQTLNLYKTIKTGTNIYRVRIHNENENFETAAELGPPPIEFTIHPNRMSPSGIPMFYGAFKIETAIQETYSHTGRKKIATVGQFKTVKTLTVVDLSTLPPAKGFFSNEDRMYRHGLFFLKGFLEDFTAPVSKDGKEHIEYVPTQVVSEHLRYIHQTPIGISIDGIIYPSSKNGEKAIVIFCDNSNCSDQNNGHDKTLLRLEKTKRVIPEE